METNSNNIIITIVNILSAIGAINWGLIGLFEFNLVTFLFASFPIIVKLIYIVVGFSGVYLLFSVSKTLLKKV